MDTLRGAIGAAGVRRFYSKPDRFSRGYELRRFAAEGTASRPPTDFFELYWAPHFDAGRFGTTLGWAFRLLVRQPFWRLGRQLRGAMGVLQVGLVLLIALVGWVLVRQFAAGGLSAAAGWASGTFTAVIAGANLVAGYVVTRVLADAARYLTPKPEHVLARNAIREEGVHLLRALHDSGVYQRVVVVGHSLGSVIGLDILRITFDELRHPDPTKPVPKEEAEAFRGLVEALPDNPSPTEIDRFQQAQRRLWRESRERGVRWLVTDFVTLGSPLAHAPLLLDGKRASLRQRQEEKEYPTCPPRGDILYPRTYNLPNGSKRSGLLLDHGAVFAVTTWSNAWFPVTGLYGDPVGGPLQPVWGRGIRDVPVRLTSRRRHRVKELFLLAHTQYFRRDLDLDADLLAVEVAREGAGSEGDAQCDETTSDAIRESRKDLDRMSGTKVSHVAFESMLQLASNRGKKLPPPPPPRKRPADNIPSVDELED